MLGLGFWEIAMVGLVLLVVVGPERLPQVMRWAGQNYGKLRRMADELRRAFVLEADRQDAEERLRTIKERQAEATARAAAARAGSGEGATAQPPRFTPPAVAPSEDAPPEGMVTPAPFGTKAPPAPVSDEVGS